ncbi:Planctomycete cytochrome C [Stieleria bergensis]|uniref:Planctomycete cytochrome C n=1 Tax=Stieleria bergensis TaxID=2528025 RepID=A0A517SSN8_9BACT|nr:Planctomycete cytochrome C [Planctomycetes bacterium SV_7m_r]
MKLLYFCLLAICCASVAPSALADEPAITLQAARALGRANSNLLNPPAKQQTEATARPDQAELYQANVTFYHQSLKQVLIKSCLSCHGPDEAEGRLRIDQLDPDLISGKNVSQWREIYHVLSNSEMPPEDEPEVALADQDRAKIIDWLSEEMRKASVVRRSQQTRSSFRRLTKYEYNYAIQDLLGLSYEIAEPLPPETVSEEGFKNNSDLLQMSTMQFESYRAIGLKALRRATVMGPRPEPVQYRIVMQDELTRLTSGKEDQSFQYDDESAKGKKSRQHLYNRQTGQAIQFSNAKANPLKEPMTKDQDESDPVVLVMPRNNELKLNLDRFLPDEGIMRVSMRTGRSTNHPDEFAALRFVFSAHTSNNANFSQTISRQDLPITATIDSPETVHFDIELGEIQRNPFRKLTTTFPRRDEFLHIRNVSNAHRRDQPLQVWMESIEITAPFYEQWPPKSHQDIFIASKHQDNEDHYAVEVLTHFLTRLWQRPVHESDVTPYVKLFKTFRTDFESFEGAMVEVLATAMASPEFLYVIQKQESPRAADDAERRINDFELAKRLSLFLWSSLPDEQLYDLANRGTLSDPEVLGKQVDRMLADPRAKRFATHFVTQWLGLDGLDSITHIKDADLAEAIRREPIELFREVLNQNHSVMDFLHADYAVVNERLAAHYRIPNVRGPDFRPVAIDQRVQRGGVMTCAAVLAMNSDGKDSHPLKRGVWMLERILHDPPPPPPPNVPEVDLTDPRILQMTLKERIADHRNKPACFSCHARIDPWGIAFENYDAMGSFRTKIKNAPVDASAQLFNKQTLDGVDGLKRYLLTERQDQFARAMVHKMATYALGRPMSFGDHADLETLTQKLRQNDDQLRDLVHLITESDLFHSP